MSPQEEATHLEAVQPKELVFHCHTISRNVLQDPQLCVQAYISVRSKQPVPVKETVRKVKSVPKTSINLSNLIMKDHELECKL
ncbi:Morc Family Cw-Type Zinc Finger Protein 1 [Manis pentadactyla]|nr:Morc Family Cw-Type Zinc Finger Protein 1 [Manis pentadactyla]